MAALGYITWHNPSGRVISFRFHNGTIKSAFSNSRTSSVIIFQFHMVRLKARVDLHKFMPMITFQFHMVRLKDTCILKTLHLGSISIPHGTIKSFYVPNRIIDDAISIPHGTIKRSRSPAIPPRFQRISIPHGTIKSRLKAFQRAGIRGYRLFQFHMVRLKEAIGKRKNLLRSNFNSTWYD